MLPDGSIQAEQLWKRFRADRRGMLLRHEMRRMGDVIQGRDTSRHWRWALRDVNLSMQPGESVGLVGPNGSGKTTLLKILSKVMHPYAGKLDVVGRIGALIEIRAGIHPDLTGAENIYLFGSLLGLKRKEVARRFDDIVAFAELEAAVDRQAKFYSSGMQMRLGFSVAAFLEPDVLLVDEILAVGDAAFQQRCLERMREVLAQGTTVVYVSHDLASVEATCSRGIWLANGVVQSDGPVHDVLDEYRHAVESAAEIASAPSTFAKILGAEVLGADAGHPRTNGPVEIRLRIEGLRDNGDPLHHLYVGMSDGPAAPIFVLRHDVRIVPGEFEARCSIPNLPLPKGRFYLWLGVFGRSGGDLVPWHPVRSFEVIGKDLDVAPRAIVRPVPVYVEAAWDIEHSNGHGNKTTRVPVTRGTR